MQCSPAQHSESLAAGAGTTLASFQALANSVLTSAMSSGSAMTATTLAGGDTGSLLTTRLSLAFACGEESRVSEADDVVVAASTKELLAG